VYRLKDTCVIVAVDEVPEEGLDQPLRLEQLANEVREGKGWSEQSRGVCGGE
jgi:hypothetical protein